MHMLSQGETYTIYVHGDDYVSICNFESLRWLQEQLEKSFQVKTQVFGFGEKHMKQVKIFNIIITWHSQKGISYDVDPRHVEIISRQLKLDGAKVVATPRTKEEGLTTDNQDEPLREDQATRYRALVARCNYFSPGRPDIAFSVK